MESENNNAPITWAMCIDCDWSGNIKDCDWDDDWDEFYGRSYDFPICPQCGGGVETSTE